jgi:hypothetical protein
MAALDQHGDERLFRRLPNRVMSTQSEEIAKVMRFIRKAERMHRHAFEPLYSNQESAQRTICIALK